MGLIPFNSEGQWDEIKAEVKRKRETISKEHPEYVCRIGCGDVAAQAMHADIVIEPIESAAGVWELPFMLLPRKDECKDGRYIIQVEERYCNNKPFYENAPCTNIEFVVIWAMALKLLGYLKIPTIAKDPEEIIYQRDCSLLFAYKYFGIDCSEIF